MVFIVLNPAAGNCEADVARQAFRRHFGGVDWVYEVYETTGEERVAEIVRAALGRGVDLAVAAGGDGTISRVVDGLVHTGVPLGIVPIGTGNALARDLGIPLDLERALSLLTGEHTVVSVDAMQVDDRFCLLSVGIGISALMMRDTEREDKRRFGPIAYLWTGFAKLCGFQPCCFTLLVDGRRRQFRASEVTIANSGSLGDPAFRWGPQIRMNDGRLDVCIVRARTVLGYFGVIWNILLRRPRRDPRIRFLSGVQSITVDAQEPLPVQGDGEVIGQTPVYVQVVPGGVRVIAPVAGQRRSRTDERSMEKRG
jgi:YegS/Rv2252/BmrU family lipid kinase